MRTCARLVITAAVTLLTASAVAENPFAGTWKFDPSKSKITGDTVTFTPEAGGAIKLTAAGQSYSFKPDGSPTPTPFGNTVAWTKIDDNTWKAVYSKDSTVLDTDTWKLPQTAKLRRFPPPEPSPTAILSPKQRPMLELRRAPVFLRSGRVRRLQAIHRIQE